MSTWYLSGKNEDELSHVHSRLLCSVYNNYYTVRVRINWIDTTGGLLSILQLNRYELLRAFGLAETKRHHHRGGSPPNKKPLPSLSPLEP